MSSDQFFMSEALAMAQKASVKGEVPVGAVVVAGGRVVGRGFNQPIISCDPSAHAEIIALRDAAKNLNNYRLAGCSLYVTIEPCAMCVGALVHARIERVVFGATEPRAGALASQMKMMDLSHFNHRFDWEGGVLERECGTLMKQFFRTRR
jgi:tRNA(adenine34) deaminase